MDIIELTRKLGAAIQQEEAYKNFIAIRTKNDNDEELQKQIGEICKNNPPNQNEIKNIIQKPNFFEKLFIS